MDLFLIDKKGDCTLFNKSNEKLITYKIKKTQQVTRNTRRDDDDKNGEVSGDEIEIDSDPEYDDYFGLPPASIDISNIIQDKFIDKHLLAVVNNVALDRKPRPINVTTINDAWINLPTKTNVKVELEQSVLKDIEKKHSIPNLSEKKKLKLRQAERAKTKGKNWFDLPATEMTDEIKRDIEIIKMRSVLDTSRFYKKNDLKTLPKYFQIGHVIPSQLDYHNERGIRKSKKHSLVDDLLADVEFQRKNKRKYTEIQESKSKSSYYKEKEKKRKLKKK